MADVRWTPAQADAIRSRGRSIAVSAAAGSGKTAVLTRRIIERILEGKDDFDISRVLVVTFTKAAASELCSRITDALNTELAAHPENKHIKKQSMLVSSAHISTIHSFCLDLIRTNFQKLDIPADFSAGGGAEVDLLMKEIADELITDYFEGELLDGEEPIEDFSHFADTFGDMTRGEKLSEVIVGVYHSLSSTLDFLALPRRFVALARDAARDGFTGSIWEKVICGYLKDLLRHYLRIYEDALSHIREHEELQKYEPVFAAELEEIRFLLCDAESGCEYQRLSDALSRHEVTRLPVVRGVGGDRAMNFYKDARTEFHKELRRVREEHYAARESEMQGALLETAKMLESLSVFLESFEKRFRAEKFRRRMITFADMERLALSLLWERENDRPSELALAMRESFDEIYIDEYQDTNEIQDKIFFLVSKENNRFHVGDIKQSIYSFRGAEPSIFENLLLHRPKYEGEDEKREVKIYLSENFRSSAEILGFCNRIFDVLMNAEERRYGEDERLNCGSGKHAPVPEIYLLPKKSEDDEDEDALGEAEFVAEKIAALLANGKKADGSDVKPSDIVILLRSTSTSSAIYEEALTRRGIPCRNGAALSFFESAEVLLMLSLLTAIDNPRRDVPLAAALKSPIYGVTLDELLFIRKHKTDGALIDALRAFTEETGFAKGKRFLSDLERYAEDATEMPSDALIWQILGESGIFSALGTDGERPLYEIEEARSNLIMLYDYARSFEKGGFKGLSGFISFINEVIANDTKMDISQFSAPGEVVNIMTIHKSKGLEFPICFVSETAKRFHLPEARERVVFDGKLGIAMKLVEEDGVFRHDNPLRGAAILARKKSAVEEELRVLYVALTRAKERLFVTGSVPKKAMEDGVYDIFDPFSEYAMKKRFFSAYTLRKAPSYLELLLIALAGEEGFALSVGAEDQTILLSQAPQEILEPAPTAEDMTPFAARKAIRERLDFEYPYQHLADIPSKLSVSKLHPTVLDESDEGTHEQLATAERRPLVMPKFLMEEPDEYVTAAERGTATHTFMQFCDFERVMAKGIDAEVARLVEKRFLFPADAEKVDRKRLSVFFHGELAREILSSSRVYREKRFMIRYPASRFTAEPDKKRLLREETLLVQGVIDCAFYNAMGELILVDYKTDSFARHLPRETVEQTLRERHTRQLMYYAYACRVIYGVYPKHIYIYSFALGGIVEIFQNEESENEHEQDFQT